MCYIFVFNKHILNWRKITIYPFQYRILSLSMWKIFPLHAFWFFKKKSVHLYIKITDVVHCLSNIFIWNIFFKDIVKKTERGENIQKFCNIKFHIHLPFTHVYTLSHTNTHNQLFTSASYWCLAQFYTYSSCCKSDVTEIRSIYAVPGMCCFQQYYTPNHQHYLA